MATKGQSGETVGNPTDCGAPRAGQLARTRRPVAQAVTLPDDRACVI